MKVQVICYSRSGGTKKVADRIAREVGAEVQRPDDVSSLDGDLVFLGSGLYAGSAHDSVKALLERNDLSGKTIAPFSTHAAIPYEFDDVRSAVEKAGGKYLDGFLCYGQFLFIINRGRPNESDLEDAARFARRTLESVKVRG
ncbi:MAG: flavodoxin family protein [Candidatus Undinarchaeales archaeon]|nr:flavodoxin family protein [Candidatus Undinarchaeales archaeon]MDP7494547.1 flavodoxin family protein [Candidatus Undinarchaeales archaeon]